MPVLKIFPSRVSGMWDFRRIELCYICITIVSNRRVNDITNSITYMWRLIWDTRLILNIITMGWYEMLRLISNTKLDMWRLIWDTRLILNIITIGWYEMLRLISNTKLDASGAVHDCIYTMTYEWVCIWTWNPLWWYTQSYDSVISIGGVWTLWAKDRLYYYGSSMYME